MSEAITQAAAYDLIDRFLRNNLYDDDYAKYSEALEALSQPAPSPQPAAPVVSDEQIKETIDCIDWSQMVTADDYMYMIARAILALRPAVEPMTDEVRRSYQCLLAMNTPHGFGDRIGPFVKWLQDSGITAKAEDDHQPTKEAGKP